MRLKPYGSRAFLIPVMALAVASCAVVEHVGVGILGKRATLPASQILHDLPYGGDAAQKLDLYLPEGKGGPALVFVHGGGWDTGDKTLTAGGLDVYSNIGRLYASHGIMTAVINYRLMPGADWKQQAEDVALAVKWVHANAAKHGADPKRLFLMGHSAGAQLASLVALNQGLQRAAGIEDGTVSGLIAASGAALDLLDDETYKTEDIHYYEKRFGTKNRETWAMASPVTHIDETDPPVLVLYATGESKGLQRQAHVFYDKLKAADIEAQLVPVPGESHSRMVLVLSHPAKVAVPEILHFVLAGPE